MKTSLFDRNPKLFHNNLPSIKPPNRWHCVCIRASAVWVRQQFERRVKRTVSFVSILQFILDLCIYKPKRELFVWEDCMKNTFCMLTGHHYAWIVCWAFHLRYDVVLPKLFGWFGVDELSGKVIDFNFATSHARPCLLTLLQFNLLRTERDWRLFSCFDDRLRSDLPFVLGLPSSIWEPSWLGHRLSQWRCKI